jgi:hypothetical protein
MKIFEWVIPQGAMITAKHLDGNTDVVVTVNAYRMISDGINSTQTPVSIGLTNPTEGFVPYEDLTKEIVEQWLNELTDVEYLDKQLVITLDNIVNPKTIILPNPF